MRREELGGWCMIAGAVLELGVMAFHPPDTERPGLVLAVHSAGLAAVPVATYGGWALTRRLAAGGPLAELALAFYGMSAVAALMAATASGLLAPEIAARAVQSGGGPGLAGLPWYNFAVNQAFAKILVAASSAAIGLWSFEILRTRSMPRSLGMLGCAVAVLVSLLQFSGRLALDVHGFGAVVLAQAIWLVVTGAELRRTGQRPVGRAPAT